jgi:aspartate kinase
MIVMKFGGSSVGDASRMRRVCEIVRRELSRRPIVVVSALRGVTDDLLKLTQNSLSGDCSLLSNLTQMHERVAHELGLNGELIKPCLKELADLAHGIGLVKELTARTLDYAASFGERLSARLIAAFFKSSGMDAHAYDAPELGLLTNDRFGWASPLPEAEEEIRQAFSKVSGVPVITGFIGCTRAGDITTLGRNGSDYSATIFGAALGAEEIQIWSDTDGIMTADPRLVPEAKPLEILSFEEACELAYYGGKVLHPHTLVPAMRRNIPVRVLNTFKPDHPGTRILAHPEGNRLGVKSIAFRRHQRIVSITSPRMAAGHGFLARIFQAFARHEISVNMIATSEVTVSVTLDGMHNMEPVLQELSGEFEISLALDRAVICVVGDGIQTTPGIAGEVFSVLKEEKINVLMISQGASKNNITFVVEERDVQNAVCALHRRFFGCAQTERVSISPPEKNWIIGF